MNYFPDYDDNSRTSRVCSAFKKVCADPERADEIFLSLYAREPFYGGPEEGGWWGADVVLVASQRFISENDARAAKERTDILVAKLSKQADRQYSERCRDECDWLDARGLDSEFLPEVEGPTKYFVIVEARRGEHESVGDRYYS